MNISESFFSYFNYFFPPNQNNTVEETTPFIDIEPGLSQGIKVRNSSRYSKIDQQFPLNSQISAKEIFIQERNRLVDPNQAPGTAAGESEYFIPRQRFLLDEKYQSREGCMIRTIGNVIYTTLEKAEPAEGLPSVADLNTATDIGLLSTEKNLTFQIDRTATKVGSGSLQLILARPSQDLNLLKARQTIIKNLIEEPDVLENLKENLMKIGRTEVHFLSCWDSEKQLPGSTLGFYYRLNSHLNSVLNNSSLALDLSVASITAKKIINTAIQGLSGVALGAFAITETSRALIDSKTPKYLSDYAGRFIGTTPAGPIGTLALEINNPLINASTAATVSALCLTSLGNTYGWMKADTAMLPLMRNILSSVATYYRCMKKIHACLKNKPNITERMEHFSKMEDFITNKQGLKELEILFGLLDSFSFNEENNYSFRPGEVLLAWELLHSSTFKKKKGKSSASTPEIDKQKLPAQGDNIREAFAKVMPAIGEVDVFVSTAQLMMDSQNDTSHRVKYCFPTFIERAKTPYLQIGGVWNPRIGKEKVIPNDIILGSVSGSRGMIITGPNTGGKSCLGQGIMAATIMAQSIGIAPGNSMELTPFDYIKTSIEVRSSIEKAQSLFAAQSKSIGQIQEGVQNISAAKGFSLTLLDEPLSGTNAAAGQELVKAVAKSLIEVDSNLSIMVTHFTQVATELDSSYKNYQVKDDGSHQLKEGIYAGSNASEVAKAFGIKSTVLEPDHRY